MDNGVTVRGELGFVKKRLDNPQSLLTEPVLDIINGKLWFRRPLLESIANDSLEIYYLAAVMGLGLVNLLRERSRRLAGYD